MVKNLPAHVRDKGLILGPGRFHMAWSNYACVPQLLSLCSSAQEQQLLSPLTTAAEAFSTLESVLHYKSSHRDEKPVYCNKQ